MNDIIDIKRKYYATPNIKNDKQVVERIKQMKVLVLGGNGFIGKNLIKELICNNYDVTSFDLNLPMHQVEGVNYIQGNFFDEATLEYITEKIDVIFHAISSINPGNSNQKYMQGYENDLIYTIKLCRLVKTKNIKMIFLSSGGTVYGDQKVQPIKENSRMHPINHYGNLKLCMENTMMTFNCQENTKMIIARIANPYGIGQDFKKGVGFIDAVLKKGILNETIEIFGKGDVVRDYIYIDDVCKMLRTLIQYNGKEEVFNISSGVGYSQKEIINFAKEWIPDLKISFKNPRTIDVKKIILDNSRIRHIYDSELVSLHEGMKLYFQYLKRNITF